MTEGQRDYLADLAGQKGIRLEDTSDKSPAWASAKIEELKAMPDAHFSEVTPKLDASLDNQIAKIKKEVARWTFQA